MPINPIKFASRVNEQFLNYQLTAFPLTDPNLAEQARELLKGGSGASPLFRGPYVSLSKSYRTAEDLRDLARDGVVHPALPGLTEHPVMFSHQSETLQAIRNGKHCLIATGTGSGKTEAFLYPILDRCLEMRDTSAPEGVVAVLVYPMNALALDQLERLRDMLAGSRISFGMYVGSTPGDDSEVSQTHRMKEGETHDDYLRHKRRFAREQSDVTVSPPEERLTERDMAEHPPRLLLTNVHQLELLLTRGKDLGMFVDAPLEFLVFDEAHTYTGVRGAEVSCLIRRLRAFCGKGPDEVRCIGTSATVTDLERNEEAAEETTDFAHRFFGIDREDVVLVREKYEDEEFPTGRYTPSGPVGDIAGLLESTLQALDHRDERSVREVVQRLTGRPLTTQRSWPNALYEHLKCNEYVYALYHHLARPCELRVAVQRILSQVGREWNAITRDHEAELLCYLALGAAAESEEQPLLRPQVHYFTKGLEGAVVTFVEDEAGGHRAMLSLSLEEARERFDVARTACPGLAVCKTCGQHFLEAYYANFELDEGKPKGATARGDNAYWESADETAGTRVLFTDRFISEESDEEEGTSSRLDKKRFPLYFCRHCGALHVNPGECRNPRCERAGELVRVWGLLLDEGRLKSCPSCRHSGGRFAGKMREPVRPLQASTVADVHILAQNMLNAVEPDRQSLIVFSDNRQDAAFQAGWMKDHARRYRMRHLIYDHLRNQTTPISVGDLQRHLLGRLTDDADLGRALAPEVYEAREEEAFGTGLQNLLKRYLRFILLRELATSFKQRDSLENWGVARVEYEGIRPDAQWMQEWSERTGVEPGLLAHGLANLLDSFRRGRILYDAQTPIFSKYWHESAEEIQHGLLPHFDFPPEGIKKYREPDDKKTFIRGFLSRRGQTLAQDYVSKWGLDEETAGAFLEATWGLFTSGEHPLLRPVTLRGSSGTPLSGATGARQVDTSRLGLLPQRERYRCQVCQRVHARPGPGMACTGYRCKGHVAREEPPAEDYNLTMLELPFTMVKPAEHSGQVPGKRREELEDEFKEEGGSLNCLVSTPTLELGVDIGELDMILMRNVPPKPSNYWQRAGRAGRRHRMAVIYSYCRRSDHDRYFFEDPERMLAGQIETPQFNLRNEVMVRKHVHAAVISEMIRLAREEPETSELTEEELEGLRSTYNELFPNFISDFLFDSNWLYRDKPYSADPLREVIGNHRERLLRAVQDSFGAHWPEADRPVVNPKALAQYLDEMPDLLQAVYDRMHERLTWAVHMQEELLDKQKKGLLESYQKALLRRCQRYIERLRERNLANYVLSALANEGFLPGYGFYEQGIRAFASRSFGAVEGKQDFELDRPPAIALREFVPGNAIYANGARFRVSYYHMPVHERRVEPVKYKVDLEQERIEEAGGGLNAEIHYEGSESTTIDGIPICDLDLAYFSRISDEEDYRFQMPVSVMGYLKRGHRGISAYKIAGHEVQHRFGQQVRLVNVGAADQVAQGELGYPVCTICGGARSPYSSEADREHFRKWHGKNCDAGIMRVAFSADTEVDGLLFQGMDDKRSAVNVGEGLRIGASRILEMDVEDLQILLLPKPDESYHTFLYDPMPGGSGLLQQMVDNWLDVLSAAKEALTECPAQCETSCYECMRTYRNVFFHTVLDRHVAASLLQKLDATPQFEREDPPREPLQDEGEGHPTNRGERALEEMLEAAGFPPFEHQREIEIGEPFRRTIPDLYFEDPSGDTRVAIYLDGLSSGIHGNADARRRDRMIRQQLEAQGIDVIDIARSDLDDPELMRTNYRRIAHRLGRRDIVE
ncbi:MAG: DEAD/DEAH box helicase [Planctomycetota bacterium]